MKAFQFARMPKIRFGAGTFSELATIASSLGRTVLLVTGHSSMMKSGRLDNLFKQLQEHSLEVSHIKVKGEPTPDLVDEVVSEYRPRNVDVVLAVGGGSVMDAGKAISAMLPQGDSVFEYLEGVGSGARHSGKKVPMIAVPTTAGTGSEATKNAVLSRTGPNGFKKSLRHDNFVPDVALVDPELSLSCPAEVTATCGMDAFTQLLESYLSTNASPMTDALALSGLEHLGKSLVPACTDRAVDVGVRGFMAYAALLSGITLANAGLGLVHGLASSIGGIADVPHGVVCGTLMGSVNIATIRKLREISGPTHPALAKYAKVASLICDVDERDVIGGCDALIETICAWTDNLKIPRLAAYGVREEHLRGIVATTGNKSNPVKLGSDEIMRLLRQRL